MAAYIYFNILFIQIPSQKCRFLKPSIAFTRQIFLTDFLTMPAHAYGTKTFIKKACVDNKLRLSMFVSVDICQLSFMLVSILCYQGLCRLFCRFFQIAGFFQFLGLPFFPAFRGCWFSRLLVFHFSRFPGFLVC